MTTLTEYGWMEAPWMVADWMAPLVTATNGMQAELVIEDAKAMGLQVENQIDTTKPMGMQSELQIITGKKVQGMQSELVIDDTKPMGVQSELIVNASKADGVQALLEFTDNEKAMGMEATAQVISSIAQGMQVRAEIDDARKVLGIQIIGQVVDGGKASAFQVTSVRHTHKSCQGGWMEDDWMTGEWMTDKPCVFVGAQTELSIGGSKAMGMQVENVVATSKAMGLQALLQITDGKLAVGMQVEGTGGEAMGMQVRVALYNTHNLRILCEFLSRGTTGNNWTASSTATGDFDPVNLNTDIVEQVWRSANLATQIVTCDAQNPVLVDTLAILGHNFSRGSSLTLQASNASNFSSIEIDESLQWTDTNIFWLSADLPATAYQYWRVVIDDPTNSDGFVQMGTLIFGTSEIFQGEFIVDDIQFGYKDFADKVNTEGFTNVSNSRSLKKTLGLEFRSLNSFKGNYEIIRDLVTTYRTTHKCLWIPTPSLTNQEATGRYALFSKLSELPRENHRSPSNDLDYASFSIDLDESN